MERASLARRAAAAGAKRHAGSQRGRWLLLPVGAAAGEPGGFFRRGIRTPHDGSRAPHDRPRTISARAFRLAWSGRPAVLLSRAARGADSCAPDAALAQSAG